MALAGLALLVLAAPLLRERALRQTQAGPAEIAATPSPPREMKAAEQVPVPSPAVARPVAPQLIAPLPIEHHELERVGAREPLGPMGAAPAPSEGLPKPMVLHRPLVTQAGEFEAMGYRIALPGLLPTPATKMCGDGNAAWPCGIHARTAFRNWLRGRAFNCVVPPAPPAEPVTTPCRLGNSDAGAWLVAQGWVYADPADNRYVELAKDARKARRGLYGTRPTSMLPAVTQGETPPEATPPD